MDILRAVNVFTKQIKADPLSGSAFICSRGTGALAYQVRIWTAQSRIC